MPDDPRLDEVLMFLLAVGGVVLVVGVGLYYWIG
jgi:hypothetical protein